MAFQLTILSPLERNAPHPDAAFGSVEPPHEGEV